MILLNRRNHHVVENHVIEIHVKGGTTVNNSIWFNFKAWNLPIYIGWFGLAF